MGVRVCARVDSSERSQTMDHVKKRFKGFVGDFFLVQIIFESVPCIDDIRVMRAVQIGDAVADQDFNRVGIFIHDFYLTGAAGVTSIRMLQLDGGTGKVRRNAIKFVDPLFIRFHQRFHEKIDPTRGDDHPQAILFAELEEFLEPGTQPHRLTRVLEHLGFFRGGDHREEVCDPLADARFPGQDIFFDFIPAGGTEFLAQRHDHIPFGDRTVKIAEDRERLSHGPREPEP